MVTAIEIDVTVVFIRQPMHFSTELWSSKSDKFFLQSFTIIEVHGAM